MITKFQKVAILLATVFVAIVIGTMFLYVLLSSPKEYNKESKKYVKLLKILKNRKVLPEKKEEAFQKLIYIYPIIREVYSLDRLLLVEEGQAVYLPIDHELIIRRKMFIDNRLISLAKFEDVIIPSGDKVFFKGYSIEPYKKFDLIFRNFMELEQGRHKFKYILDMKIVKKEKGGLKESIYHTTIEHHKEFTVINKLPENYISFVGYPNLDKHIDMDIKTISFEEDSVFNPSKGREYQKLSISTAKPSPENIASKILVLSKDGNLIGKIGNLVISKGEVIKNFTVPISLAKLQVGTHNVIIKLIPNKELALKNARMRKIWKGIVRKGIFFEIKKRKVEKIEEIPEPKEEKKVVKPKRKKKEVKKEEVKEKLEEEKPEEKKIKEEEKKEPEKKEEKKADEEKVEEKKETTEKMEEKKETKEKEEVKPKKEETKKEIIPEPKTETTPETKPKSETTP